MLQEGRHGFPSVHHGLKRRHTRDPTRLRPFNKRRRSSKGSVKMVCKHKTSKHQRKQGIYGHVPIQAAAEDVWKLAQTHLNDEHALQRERGKEELKRTLINWAEVGDFPQQQECSLTSATLE